MLLVDSVMKPHFAELRSNDVLDLNDGYSRILRPFKPMHTDIVSAAPPLGTPEAEGVPTWRHVNYFTFLRLFEAIDRHIERPVILETGSSAYGTNSSLLFAELAVAKGGIFDTVDLNPETTERVRGAIGERFGNRPELACHNGDSVEFIRRYERGPCNVAYLDSYDLGASHFRESAEHGWAEFEALLPKLDPTISFILIDDTPKTQQLFDTIYPPADAAAARDYRQAHGAFPGKGELVIERTRNDPRFKIVAWEYQVLLSFSAA